VLAALTIRNPARTPAARRPEREPKEEPTWNCGLGGPPVDPSLVAAQDRPG
jgi:hypothetical protein